MKRWFYPALAAALVLLSLYPMTATGYGIRVMLQLFMWIALAQSWNLISGLTGYVSFGHVVFFGTGAYASSLLVNAGLPWPVACLGGGVAGAVLALMSYSSLAVVLLVGTGPKASRPRAPWKLTAAEMSAPSRAAP